MNSLETNTVPHKLIIDRRYWMRGSSGTLFDTCSGQMCVLGLYLHQVVKVPTKALNGLTSPQNVINAWFNGKAGRLGTVDDGLALLASANACWLVQKQSSPDSTVVRDSDVVAEIIGVNDAIRLSDAEREAALIERFAKFNVEVEFVGEATPGPTNP